MVRYNWLSTEFCHIKNKEKTLTEKDRPYVRLIYSPWNVEKFVESVNEINWSRLYEYDNQDLAYNLFHQSIIKCHDESFRLVKLSPKYFREKVWITCGIKKYQYQK